MAGKRNVDPEIAKARSAYANAKKSGDADAIAVAYRDLNALVAADFRRRADEREHLYNVPAGHDGTREQHP